MPTWEPAACGETGPRPIIPTEDKTRSGPRSGCEMMGHCKWGRSPSTAPAPVSSACAQVNAGHVVWLEQWAHDDSRELGMGWLQRKARPGMSGQPWPLGAWQASWSLKVPVGEVPELMDPQPPLLPFSSGHAHLLPSLPPTPTVSPGVREARGHPEKVYPDGLALVGPSQHRVTHWRPGTPYGSQSCYVWPTLCFLKT